MIVRVLLALCLLAGLALGGRFFVMEVINQPPEFEQCADHNDQKFKRGDSQFQNCICEQAHIFATYDYPETKDLAKAFLTILTAVFVGSIAFSEKIIGINTADHWPRWLMITSWVSNLVAIISCGCGLALLVWALGWATHSPNKNYLELEAAGGSLLTLAGILFATSLIAMLVAGIFGLRPAALAMQQEH